MEYYDFESDMDYQMQLHETLMSRAAAQHNKLTIKDYFNAQFDDFDVSHDGHDEKNAELIPLQVDQMNYSLNQFLTFFQSNQTVKGTKTNQHELQVQYVQIIKNLKQRISDVIKERNAHYKLKRQVAIMDSLSELLEQDPLKVLTIVGYQAIVKNDEYNIPKTAKIIDPDFANRYEKKRKEMAETFCLLEFSQDVIQSCDKYDDNNRTGVPLYETRD